jgi:hypothetical protein
VFAATVCCAVAMPNRRKLSFSYFALRSPRLLPIGICVAILGGLDLASHSSVGGVALGLLLVIVGAVIVGVHIRFYWQRDDT